MKKIIPLGLSILFATGAAQAASDGFKEDNLYFGGGLSSNSASGLSNGTGFQLFAGYKLDMIKLRKIDSSVEVGYMDTGSMTKDTCVTFLGVSSCASAEAKSKGLWATYVGSYSFNRKVSGIGRLGLDLGDDSGLMFGFGADYKLDPKMHLRAEYVLRQNVNSLQLNFVYHMK